MVSICTQIEVYIKQIQDKLWTKNADVFLSEVDVLDLYNMLGGQVCLCIYLCTLLYKDDNDENYLQCNLTLYMNVSALQLFF